MLAKLQPMITTSFVMAGLLYQCSCRSEATPTGWIVMKFHIWNLH